ncbi:hypothetical protein PT276_01520 [Orbaceae bacterium ESL0721]|nr:hypothetical protein [Orbaceae bacterium ESL0721]
MDNIRENSSIWQEQIYLIKRDDPVSGGPDGIANKAAIQLADRTQYLKKELEKEQELSKRALVYTPDNPNYQANNKTIEKVSEPVNESDAATRLYVDRGDAYLQDQINDIYDNASWGWVLIGEFQTGCTITKRNHIVYDNINKQYYNWIGVLPHDVMPDTDPTDEIANGQPWIVIDNTNELVADVEEAKRNAKEALDKVNKANLPQDLEGQAGKFLAVNDEENGYTFIQSLSAFYGFRKNGAKLILETGEGNYPVNDFNECLISVMGLDFYIDKNGNLLIKI